MTANTVPAAPELDDRQRLPQNVDPGALARAYYDDAEYRGALTSPWAVGEEAGGEPADHDRTDPDLLRDEARGHVNRPTIPLIGVTPWAGYVAAASTETIPANSDLVLGHRAKPAPMAVELSIIAGATGLYVIPDGAAGSTMAGFPIPFGTAVPLRLPVAFVRVANSTGAPVTCSVLVVSQDRVGG